MRKLASVQRILDIAPIAGGDRIEVATVLGWKVVIAKKDNFQIGDLVVYIEVDSIVPERPEFEFLRERKFRVRTVRMKDQISQGLIMPLYILPLSLPPKKEGDDVTDVLGIIKYDPEAEIEANDVGIAKRNPIVKFLMRYKWFRNIYTPKDNQGFPTFVSKTDEDRIQLFPNICEKEKDTIFTVTEKLDGQSATYFVERNHFGKYEFGVCSRKLRIKARNDSNYWRMVGFYGIDMALKDIAHRLNAKTVVLQGEIVGQRIQKNKYNFSLVRFFAYNLIVDGKKYDQKLMEKELYPYAIDCVPVVSLNWKLPATIDEAVQFSIGKSRLIDDWREGVVVRNYEKGISFKIINPEFLLKWKC